MSNKYKETRTFIDRYIKAEWETNNNCCRSYGKCLITQEHKKFLGLIPYWKTIKVEYLS